MERMAKRALLLSLIILSLIVLLGGCAAEDNNPAAECVDDSGCTAAGCSGQVCTTNEEASGLITTCEWKEEYSCYQKTSCLCINNRCSWEETDAFNRCFEALR